MNRRTVLFFSIFLLLAFAFALGAAATASDKPRVSRATLVAMEKSLDGRVTRQWDDNPFVLLGATRGVYLDGYGAVFTAEVNLVAAPLGLMHPTMTKPEIERYHQKKLERIPQLKGLMRDALAASAASLDTVPPDERIIIVAFLSRYPWEDPAGIPAQVTMQALKKELLAAQHSGLASLASVIHVTEY